jgi:uncharacterized protein
VKVLGGVLLASAGWAVTFGLTWGNFWVKIGVTVVLVTAYSLLWQRPKILFRWSSAAIGVLSAAALYGIFWIGNSLAPLVVRGAHGQVGGIYGLGEGSSRIWILPLLLFVTGPGEEIFWRGFIQGRLMERWGVFSGTAAATLVYGAVHVFSGNLMLILAALVAGAFWGLQYAWRRDMLALIVSHSLWSATIFAILPVR